MRLPPFIRENVSLAGLTTFRIGGPARWLAEPATREELSLALQFANENGVPVIALGGGSNILAADPGVEAMIVKLEGPGEFARLEQDRENPLVWRAGAAVRLPVMLKRTIEAGIAGLEPLAGIPGRLGGAVAMNAGAVDKGIGSYVAWTVAVEQDGSEIRMTNSELGFNYRGSNLVGSIAVEFAFEFQERAEPVELERRVNEFLSQKKATQPLELPSAGCIFKNPSEAPAGLLIDQAGCKGWREGNAEVSRVHANFIVNHGGATAKDVALLASRLRDAVRDRHGVDMELEIVLCGNQPEFEMLIAPIGGK